MPDVIAALHPARLQRWIEALCRPQWTTLRDAVDPRGDSWRVKLDFPNDGGVYCFWWTGPSEPLRKTIRGRRVALHGPSGRAVTVQLDDEWLGIEAGAYVPLYVGKTTSGMRKRLVQHLLLSNSTNLLKANRGEKKAERPTTSCQLRAGVEDLFPNDADIRLRIIENIGLSFVKLAGDEHAANRCYLEHLAIGQMRPPLNLDIER